VRLRQAPGTALSAASCDCSFRPFTRALVVSTASGINTPDRADIADHAGLAPGTEINLDAFTGLPQLV